MTIEISPSILAADFSDLKSEVKALEDAGADRIHLDVMDGHFVPNITFGAPVIKALRPHSSLTFETHLMISPYESYLDAFIDAGSDIILIHPESSGDCQKGLQYIQSKGCKSGLVLNPATPLETSEPFLEFCDQLLIMTVEPGFGGQSFMMEQIPKIKQARALIDHYKKATGNHIDLEVDGGVTQETAKLCRDAGANVLVAGSSVFQSDNYRGNIQVLRP